MDILSIAESAVQDYFIDLRFKKSLAHIWRGQNIRSLYAVLTDCLKGQMISKLNCSFGIFKRRMVAMYIWLCPFLKFVS
jgi:hypothetical protein